MIYLKLFLTFFEIGMFTFGGGYAMISLIRDKALAFGWLTEEELLNMIAVEQMFMEDEAVMCIAMIIVALPETIERFDRVQILELLTDTIETNREVMLLQAMHLIIMNCSLSAIRRYIEAKLRVEIVSLFMLKKNIRILI
jgi:hypothetical protein